MLLKGTENREQATVTSLEEDLDLSQTPSVFKDGASDQGNSLGEDRQQAVGIISFLTTQYGYSSGFDTGSDSAKPNHRATGARERP